MKKLIAILLLAMFLFNLLGYRLLLNYIQQQTDIQLEAALDKKAYNEANLVTIKVPLFLPYINNQRNFERVSGEITIGGKILKYVKRKIQNGELILMCLPDQNKMRIASAKDEFFKYANDLVQNNQSKKSGNSKSPISKNSSLYCNVAGNANTIFYNQFRPNYCVESQLNFLPSSHQDLPEQPPELT